MANSSYDWLFAKPALRWLFHDYIDNNAHALLRLSPGEDPRVSITARFHSSLRANKGRNVVVAEQNSGITCLTTPLNSTISAGVVYQVSWLLQAP